MAALSGRGLGRDSNCQVSGCAIGWHADVLEARGAPCAERSKCLGPRPVRRGRRRWSASRRAPRRGCGDGVRQETRDIGVREVERAAERVTQLVMNGHAGCTETDAGDHAP